MKVEQNISLKPYNSFGIDVKAAYFAEFNNENEAVELLQEYGKYRPLILGGGSNILFKGNYEGIVLRNKIKGIRIVKENTTEAVIECGGGEVWNDLVNFAVSRNLGGLENLSLIPGSAGAAPIQNIGAYGVEQKDSFESLEAFLINKKTIQVFEANDCAFGYRDSIFKRTLKGNFVILKVRYRLSKFPVINTEYGAIREKLNALGITAPGIADVSKAVTEIRKSKLPDPAIIGNAGSFFKNPIVSHEMFIHLKSQYPNIPSFPAENGIKIPAAWLIETCGWKGYRKGDAGCHIHQPLVLVNYGKASGNEIYNLSEEILQSVKERFGIVLEREVNVI